mgnify:FL=1
MKIKDFIKEVKKTFGEDVEFKATSKDGQTWRSKNYDKIDAEIKKGRGTHRKALW